MLEGRANRKHSPSIVRLPFGVRPEVRDDERANAFEAALETLGSNFEGELSKDEISQVAHALELYLAEYSGSFTFTYDLGELSTWLGKFKRRKRSDSRM